MYILLPYTKTKKQDRNQSEESFSFGALASSIGNLNFTGSDGIFSQISLGMNELEDINSKYSITAMTQLLRDGKVGNQEALDYLFEGLANQLDLVKLTQGYQSLEEMKTALSSGTINAQSFLSGLGSAFETLMGVAQTKNINGEKAILIDGTLGENWGYTAETADRKVESGQTLTSFIHNMPRVYPFNCLFVDDENYSRDEFGYQMEYLRDTKTAVSVVLDEPIFGKEILENVVVIDFQVSRDRPVSGFEYSITFKEIERGDVVHKNIVIQALGSITESVANIVSPPVDEEKQEKLRYDENAGIIKNVFNVLAS